MRKTHTHFEQIPVEVAEKVLEQEKLLPKRDDNCELVVENSGTPIEPQTPSRRSRVPAA
jgi:hypothetical protein